ncbi:15103_t:CDS:2 [Acaulospora morrowiae]|uniref:15103_t:CDS:1 n=1 Tax=Acaulospora morrowiae TaxID=94023 RepID=A0A9N8YQ90_9GLOM|nr:15103_t:CDS:2 [Acaulospora morrowiae]
MPVNTTLQAECNRNELILSNAHYHSTQDTYAIDLMRDIWTLSGNVVQKLLVYDTIIGDLLLRTRAMRHIPEFIDVFAPILPRLLVILIIDLYTGEAWVNLCKGSSKQDGGELLKEVSVSILLKKESTDRSFVT